MDDDLNDEQSNSKDVTSITEQYLLPGHQNQKLEKKKIKNFFENLLDDSECSTSDDDDEDELDNTSRSSSFADVSSFGIETISSRSESWENLSEQSWEILSRENGTSARNGSMLQLRKPNAHAKEDNQVSFFEDFEIIATNFPIETIKGGVGGVRKKSKTKPKKLKNAYSLTQFQSSLCFTQDTIYQEKMFRSSQHHSYQITKRRLISKSSKFGTKAKNKKKNNSAIASSITEMKKTLQIQNNVQNYQAQKKHEGLQEKKRRVYVPPKLKKFENRRNGNHGREKKTGKRRMKCCS